MNPLPMGFLTLSIYLTFSFSLFHLTHPLCHNNERSALLQFKQSFLIQDIDQTPSWNLEENSECCSWENVICNEDTGYVIELYLTGLQGSINSSSTLFNLVHLQSLDLSYNDFSYSQIPSAIKNLSKLSYLDLSSSNFSGQIPSEMLELSRLESLDLSGNNLQLQQPGLRSLVEKLTKLKELDLSGINISSPTLNSLANLSSLTELSLQDCQLQGKLSFLCVRFNL
ncbi:hypothetical protein EZV62_027705 [Acer yangbiense]|uniref:Uncharacterized protein n=1 Tax=Acer yangbiense TaxID=1000413 RepID=A0A5C7GUL3_9ROSI|nr:hypothetical protein EZV62_027705 [Acer yangbiense]